MELKNLLNSNRAFSSTDDWLSMDNDGKLWMVDISGRALHVKVIAKGYTH